MVDVSAKDVTVRTAHAQGRFVTTPEVIALLRRDGLPKGDALAVARIAGLAGAKRTRRPRPAVPSGRAARRHRRPRRAATTAS